MSFLIRLLIAVGLSTFLERGSYLKQEEQVVNGKFVNTLLLPPPLLLLLLLLFFFTVRALKVSERVECAELLLRQCSA
jgi:hypothetical protein